MGIHESGFFTPRGITSTRWGRYLFWRRPTGRDHLRFPFLHAGEAVPSEPLPEAPNPIDAHAVPMPAAGTWPGGSLHALLEQTGTTAFIVLHEGRAVCEWFAAGVDPSAPMRTLSVTKSVAALLVAQAIEAGRLPGMDAPIGDCVPGIEDPAAARLTLEQLMRMASGIGYREGASPWSDDALVYHGTGLRQTVLTRRVTDAVDAFFHYNDWHPLLIALALEGAARASIPGLIARELWGPLHAGIATMTVDSDRWHALAHLESGLNASADGLARLGQMVLQRGQWDGAQVVPAACFERLDDLSGAWQSPADFSYYARNRLPWARPLATGHYAYKDFWWHHVPREGVHDLFAMGALGAHVYVSPDTQCVVVRLAGRFPMGLWWPPLLRHVSEFAAQR